MLKYAIIAFFVTSVHSHGTVCNQDSDCTLGERCHPIEVGPDCEIEKRCTHLETGHWGYQSCECTHNKAGICMESSSECSEMSGEIVDGICPTREDMTWKCCAFVTNRRCANQGGECHYTNTYDCKAPNIWTNECFKDASSTYQCCVMDAEP